MSVEGNSNIGPKMIPLVEKLTNIIKAKHSYHLSTLILDHVSEGFCQKGHPVSTGQQRASHHHLKRHPFCDNTIFTIYTVEKMCASSTLDSDLWTEGRWRVRWVRAPPQWPAERCRCLSSFCLIQWVQCPATEGNIQLLRSCDWIFVTLHFHCTV